MIKVGCVPYHYSAYSIQGAQLLGKGITKTTDVVIANSDKGDREVTEEEKKRIEERQKNTQAFLKGIISKSNWYLAGMIAYSVSFWLNPWSDGVRVLWSRLAGG